MDPLSLLALLFFFDYFTGDDAQNKKLKQQRADLKAEVKALQHRKRQAEREQPVSPPDTHNYYPRLAVELGGIFPATIKRN